jgi:hypothetical protein
MKVIVAKGSVEKQVVCETCGHGYSYTMTREAMGSHHGFALTGEEQAKKEAEDAHQKLKEMLECECDVRPCPKCGALTRQMRSRSIQLPFMCIGGAIISAGILAALYALGLRSGIWFIGSTIVFAGAFFLFVLAFFVTASNFFLFGLRKNQLKQANRKMTPEDKSAQGS